MTGPGPNRRQFLRLLAAGAGAGALPARLGAAARAPAPGTADFCTTPASFDQPLHVPGRSGLLGHLRTGAKPLRLDAVERAGQTPALAFAASAGGRDYLDPTLVVARGERLAVTLNNALAEPTIAHWHGLVNDTANDGNGERLAAPGASFEYAFTVRNRAGLYWYHPHPHGLTAGQAYRGLFGLMLVEDDDELALRRALDLAPGETEIPLVLHDRRSGAADRYAPSPADVRRGWYGDEPLVNFTPRPYLDVAPRRCRFRILNASNARIFRLAVRRDDGRALPLLLAGTDGGLLDMPLPVGELFVAPAERIDVLVDFTSVPAGRVAHLESIGFDPMHLDVHSATDDASARDVARQSARDAAGDDTRKAAEPGDPPVSGSDGAPFALLQFRVRGRAAATPALPARLAAPTALPTPPADADERPLRLGFAKGRWRINDRVYDVAATPVVVVREAVETWLLRNYHASMPHAMHLHGFQFRVLERETSPDALAPLAVDTRGRLATDLGWKDTVLVWPGESVRLAIDFRHPFAGSQVYLFHCHNLEHEDGGMMLRVQVG
jgi:suppressor of ftsI/bilirubin oxidase